MWSFHDNFAIKYFIFISVFTPNEFDPGGKQYYARDLCVSHVYIKAYKQHKCQCLPKNYR